jgi:predicted GTPase
MTHHIEITHNPFIVETQFIINGQPPAEGCKLSSYKESRLQVWIEKLFDELRSLFNGDTDFTITFRGVESDYLDVVEAANVAKDKGMTVDVQLLEAQPIGTRLDQIQQLMKKAQEHPKFEAYLRENDEMSKSFEDAFNRDFDVYVVATMSAGKSTLINAMLGCDLLPARNEATTTTIARITDNDRMVGRFSAKRIDEKENVIDSTEEATLQTIEEWNKLNDTLRIDIEGNILAIKERDSVRLVLTDSPGPNNSQNDKHERTTMGHIQDSRRNPLILYVLNAGQLATTDDRNLLGLVAKTMSSGGKQSKDRFIFVINKMDVFDPEKGEGPQSVLEHMHKYLTDNGIHDPLIYPVSANLTRLIRKPSVQHTRKERGDFKSMADLFTEEPSMNLLQYMPITPKVKRALDSKKYSPLELSSGLPAVEAMIDEYIDKYNLPHRVKRAYDALNKAIEVGLNEAHLIEQLDQDERALKRIKEEIQVLEQRREKGFDATAYKDKVEREGKVLPKTVENTLHRLEVENKELFLKIQGEFHEPLKVENAKIKVQEAESKLRFHFNELINEYESTFIESQKAITRIWNCLVLKASVNRSRIFH